MKRLQMQLWSQFVVVNLFTICRAMLGKSY
jgi:hypothetical protein